MSDIVLKMRGICSVRSVKIRGEQELRVKADMTHEDMKEAVSSFLEHVTDKEWREWIEEFTPGYLKEEK